MKGRCRRLRRRLEPEVSPFARTDHIEIVFPLAHLVGVPECRADHAVVARLKRNDALAGGGHHLPPAQPSLPCGWRLTRRTEALSFTRVRPLWRAGPRPGRTNVLAWNLVEVDHHIVRRYGGSRGNARVDVFQKSKPRFLRPPLDKSKIENDQIVGVVHADE